MNFAYVAYTKEQKLIRGKIPADSQESAARLLSYSGYQVLSLRPQTSFLDFGSFGFSVGKVTNTEVILFSRQLALLLESGIDIVTAFELLHEQTVNKTFKRVLENIAADIRGGSSLSSAMSRHPKVFSQVYSRSISAGEQGGNLEAVLKNMANFLERITKTEKKIKGALTYPAIVVVVAFIVVAIMVAFVLPTFTSLYTSLGTDLPAITQILINVTTWLTDYGLYAMGGMLVLAVIGWMYTKTPSGKYHWSGAMLKAPVLGRIIQLSELSRICQTMSLLFRSGLPLPEIMSQTISATNNKVVSEALTTVNRDLIRGEGLAKPMAKHKLFLPLMVQMIEVGEETGRLDETLTTVFSTYDVEADDRITSAINLIQPIMVVGIGLVIAFVALALVSSMYSLYGQMGG